MHSYHNAYADRATMATLACKPAPESPLCGALVAACGTGRVREAPLNNAVLLILFD